MRSNYPWLKKAQDVERKAEEDSYKELYKKLAVMSGSPLSAQYDTGYGENGKLEPDKPTHMLQTNFGPRTVHEGEQVNVGPQGNFQVIPASQMGGQQQLSQVEQQNNIKGYQFGTGSVLDRFDKPETILDQRKPLTLSGTPAPQESSPSLREGLRSGLGANFGQVPTQVEQPITTGGMPAQRTMPGASALDPRTSPFGGAGSTQPQAGVIEQEPLAIASRQAPAISVQPQVGAIEQEPLAIPSKQAPTHEVTRPYTGGARTQASIGDPTQADRERYKSIHGYYPGQEPAAAEEDETTGDVITEGGEKIPPGTITSDDINYLRRYAEGQAPMTERLRQQLRSQFAGRRTAAMGALSQQAAQLGLTPAQLLTEQAMRSRELGAQEEAALTPLLKQQAQQAFSAAQSIPGLANQAELLSFAKQKYADTKEYEDFEYAAEYGDDATLSAAYEKMFGKTPDNAMIQDLRNYVRTTRVQDLERGEQAVRMGDLGINAAEIQNTTAQFNLDSAKATDVAARIARGETLEMVRDDLLAAGANPNNIQEVFDSMLEASPLGERDWNRQVAYINTLLGEGGPDNLALAQQILGERFGWTGIDFNRRLTAENATDFNTGLTQLTTYANDFGMSFDDAKDVMTKDGTFKFLGIDPDSAEAEKLYQGIRQNAIDKMFQTVHDSDFYKNLDTTERAEWDDILTGFTENFILGKALMEQDDDGNWVIKELNEDGTTVNVYTKDGQMTDEEYKETPEGRSETYGELVANLPAEIQEPGQILAEDMGFKTQAEIENWYYNKGGKAIVPIYQEIKTAGRLPIERISDDDLRTINTAIKNKNVPADFIADLTATSADFGQMNAIEIDSWERTNAGKIISFPQPEGLVEFPGGAGDMMDWVVIEAPTPGFVAFKDIGSGRTVQLDAKKYFG